MKIEIQKYAMYVFRRGWIVLLLAALLGGIVYVNFDSQAESYRAETRIFIGSAIYTPELNLNDVNIALRLAPTYAELVKNSEVMMTTIDELGLEYNGQPMTIGRLKSKVSARVILDTAILVVRVTDGNAELARDIANTIALNLIEFTPSNLTQAEEEQLDILNQQIQALQEQISITDQQVVDALARLNEAVADGRERDEITLREEYDNVVNQRSASQNTLAQFSDTFIGLSNRVNRLEIIDEAQVPFASQRTSPKVAGAIAAIAGAGIAIAALLLYFEYIDNKIRTEGEINNALTLPVLGHIPLSRQVGSDYKKNVISPVEPNSKIFEGYRKVLINLFFSSPNRDNGEVYLISSPNPSEGRSLTLTNLAVVAADSGMRVLVIDSNLRQPTQHKVFNVDNSVGLTGLLNEVGNNPKIFEKKSDIELAETLQPYVHSTAIQNLSVLTSGVEGLPLSAHILGFDNLRPCVDALRKAFHFDVILLDTPPALKNSDSYLLSVMTSAFVVLLAEAGQTSMNDLTKVRDQFVQVGAALNGVILNKT